MKAIIDNKKYDAIKTVGNDFYAVREGYKWGLIDSCNNVLMRTVYDYISFDDGVLWARYKGFRFVVPFDKLPLEYDCYYDFDKDDWAKVEKNEKYGAINRGFKEIIPCRFDRLDEFGNVIYAWIKDGEKTKKGVFSTKGEVLLDCVYESVDNPIIKKEVDGTVLCGLIDEDFKISIPCENTSIKPCQNHHGRFYSGFYEIIQRGGFHFIWTKQNGLIDIGYNRIECGQLLHCYRKQYFVK